jgi:lysozyme family protein
MVASNFPASLALVLKSEGGNSDNPADHGGRTSRGITQASYDAWRAENGLAPLDVWSAPQADVNAIYLAEYWMPYCDLMPIGVDYIFFNNSVLDGPYRSAVLLQQALGVVADGRIGPITRQALAAADPVSLIIKISAASAAFYRSLHQPTFTQGWLNRVAFVSQNALAMVKEGRRHELTHRRPSKQRRKAARHVHRRHDRHVRAKHKNKR